MQLREIVMRTQAEMARRELSMAQWWYKRTEGMSVLRNGMQTQVRRAPMPPTVKLILPAISILWSSTALPCLHSRIMLTTPPVIPPNRKIVMLPPSSMPHRLTSCRLTQYSTVPKKDTKTQWQGPVLPIRAANMTTLASAHFKAVVTVICQVYWLRIFALLAQRLKRLVEVVRLDEVKLWRSVMPSSPAIGGCNCSERTTTRKAKPTLDHTAFLIRAKDNGTAAYSLTRTQKGQYYDRSDASQLVGLPKRGRGDCLGSNEYRVHADDCQLKNDQQDCGLFVLGDDAGVDVLLGDGGGLAELGEVVVGGRVLHLHSFIRFIRQYWYQRSHSRVVFASTIYKSQKTCDFRVFTLFLRRSFSVCLNIKAFSSYSFQLSKSFRCWQWLVPNCATSSSHTSTCLPNSAHLLQSSALKLLLVSFGWACQSC